MTSIEHPLDALSDTQLATVLAALSRMYPPPRLAGPDDLSDNSKIMRLQYLNGQHSVVNILEEHQRQRLKRKEESDGRRNPDD